MLQNWRLFHQVVENMNGIVGIGEDVGNADPFYVRCRRRQQGGDPLANAAPAWPSRAALPRTRAATSFSSLPPRSQHWGALSGFLSFLERGIY